MRERKPEDLYPWSLQREIEARPGDRREILKCANEKASAWLRKNLRPGDRIRATRAECCAYPATYTFAEWDKNWIVSKSGIATLIPASVKSVNGKPCPDWHA